MQIDSDEYRVRCDELRLLCRQLNWRVEGERKYSDALRHQNAELRRTIEVQAAALHQLDTHIALGRNNVETADRLFADLDAGRVSPDEALYQLRIQFGLVARRNVETAEQVFAGIEPPPLANAG